MSPVTVPPAAAVALTLTTFTGRLRRVSPALLATTVVLGFAGVGFHVYGVHRNMGGWRNWSQNVLQGPPLPAFTGLAVAGFAALALLRGEEAA